MKTLAEEKAKYADELEAMRDMLSRDTVIKKESVRFEFKMQLLEAARNSQLAIAYVEGKISLAYYLEKEKEIYFNS